MTLPNTDLQVAILLCTFNGQSYLQEQLNSFTRQSYGHWQLWVSDDGSKDKTPNILRRYQRSAGCAKVKIQAGPQQGYVANFMSMTCQDDIEADIYAYADQDDVWEPDKLQRAINWLDQVERDIPALYCSRTRVVDSSGAHLGFSPLFRKPPSFANALVQNIGGGNTMVFNRAARDLLRQVSRDSNIVSQDWWAYMVVSGCGGQVFYDPYPSVRYRQHGANLVGANSSWVARAVRMRMLWQGRYKGWTDLNLAALERCRNSLSEDSRDTLDRFIGARKATGWQRLRKFFDSGVYRQTALGSISLLLAAMCGKV
ncbi:glycosyltransferase family 2 protein [Nitrincola sp.]|uniref:glycosyltransferase family 2 protein n=1 Tax=Nitrincola sp. TaxID=1926584 RepID=UPI003A8ECAC4